MTIKSLRQQLGYLTLVTVALIIIVGFIAVALAYITFSSSFATINVQQSTAALYLAESGLEDATHELTNYDIAVRSNCSGLSLSNSIGDGTYTVTGSGPSAPAPPSTLSAAVTATATTIPVTSSASYQSAGRLMIDREYINYTSISGNNFVGVIRGVDGTVAASHASGARVAQLQCNLTSDGGVPTLSPGTSGGKRILTEAVQLEEGWAAGNRVNNSTWDVPHWNRPTEKTWTQQSPAVSGAQNLAGVSAVSNADVWVVGANARALHYDGAAWSNLATGIAGGTTITAVSAISSREAWISSSQGRVYKWSGSSWAQSSGPSGTLNGISMVDTDGDGVAEAGWTVGSTRVAFQYNGSTWASANTGITVNLNSVSTLSSTDAWAAGTGGRIFHWTGSGSWTIVTTPSTSPTINSISMIQSGGLDIGWAVGTTSTAWYYNGSSWTSKATGLAGGLTINEVVTISPNEAWLVDSSGHIYEWNNSTWTLIFTASTALTTIDIVHSGTQPYAGWKENFG